MQTGTEGTRRVRGPGCGSCSPAHCRRGGSLCPKMSPGWLLGHSSTEASCAAALSITYWFWQGAGDDAGDAGGGGSAWRRGRPALFHIQFSSLSVWSSVWCKPRFSSLAWASFSRKKEKPRLKPRYFLFKEPCDYLPSPLGHRCNCLHKIHPFLWQLLCEAFVHILHVMYHN